MGAGGVKGEAVHWLEQQNHLDAGQEGVLGGSKHCWMEGVGGWMAGGAVGYRPKHTAKCIV